MNQILLATQNSNKVRELTALLADTAVQVLSFSDLPPVPEVVETGTTFEANARLKVQAAVKHFHLPTLADDSGLEVTYLHGRPGVYSARYAGNHDDAANNAKLLSELAGVAPAQRTAQFVTTLVFQDPATNKEIVTRGCLKGQIATVPQGDNGFGYDPLFYIPAANQTLAQMSTTEKNRLSHRGQALRKFVQQYRLLYQK